MMKDHGPIEGRDGAFNAYIARPKATPPPAVVVLHEVFGVNADIRKTCDELAEEGLVCIAIGSTQLCCAGLPVVNVPMSVETTAASALDFRSRSSSQSPQPRNVRLPSSNGQIPPAAVQLPERETDLFLLGIRD
jgi:hypothetical protein